MNDYVNFDTVVRIFPNSLKLKLLSLPDSIKKRAKEIRLRSDRPLILCLGSDNLYLTNGGEPTYIFKQSCLTVSKACLSEIFANICENSVYSFEESINKGFVTIKGGHRVGICGTAVLNNNEIKAIREISSFNIRIAGEYKGVGDILINTLYKSNLKSILIVGAPNSGKTTMLRDLARQLSDKYKISIIDERSEIAACQGGVALFDVGVNTDIMNLYPKAKGIFLAVRCFSPDVIICDEITDMNEINEMKTAMNCGAKFICSIHASTEQELVSKPQFSEMLNHHLFDYLVFLDSKTPCSITKIIKTEELNNEDSGMHFDRNIVFPFGNAFKPKLIM